MQRTDLFGKDPDCEKDWRQEEKGMAEDERVWWHHRLNGHEFEWTPGDGDGQGGLVCCDSWGRKESDTTEQLNWTELMGPDVMILVFRMLSFKLTFSLSSFSFIKSLFSSSSLSAIKVVSSACLRLLVFLLVILIPACASSSPAFHMIYSAYKLNKQDDNMQPWRTPCPIWNQVVVPYSLLTVASWPVYRFLRWQVKGLVFPSLSEFSTLYCDPRVKGFGVVNKAEIDVFLELLLFWWSRGCWQFDLWFLCLF